jgi:hypothetical protein
VFTANCAFGEMLDEEMVSTNKKKTTKPQQQQQKYTLYRQIKTYPVQERKLLINFDVSSGSEIAFNHKCKYFNS